MKAWLVRGRLPHAIESTAQLTDALLHDEVGGPQLVFQLAFATAICRFVNGLLDPAQKSHFAVPMHTLARNLGLPASFVEIRHAATHEVLPSMTILRKACTRALDWLWANYWKFIDAENDDNASANKISTGVQSLHNVQQSRIKMLLAHWKANKKDELEKYPLLSGSTRHDKDDSTILQDIAVACTEEEGTEILVDCLLNKEVLLVSEQRFELCPVYNFKY